MNTIAPLYKMLIPLVLASGSPRRREILSSVGLEFEVIPSPTAEPLPDPGESPEDFAMRAACAKALDVHGDHPDKAVLGSDTIVILGNDILGKPVDEEEAYSMLSRLAGHTHRVVTGCCLHIPSQVKQIQFYQSTDVTMRQASKEELRAYASCGEPMDKAGAYAVQGAGGFLVKKLTGSHSNVIGLPLVEVLEVLIKCGGVEPKLG